MQMFDMHSHILPGVDDGAKNKDASIALLSCLKKQGVDCVCLTPHYYTHEISLENFVSERNRAFENFKTFIPGDMRVVLGAEVYVTKYLFSNDSVHDICYGESRYILAEFPYNVDFSGKSFDMLDRLMNEYGLIPVLPHVERYYNIADNPKIIGDIKDLGVVIQTNISNYARKAPMFKRRKLLRFINDGLIDIIGSDAHSFTHNTPEVYSEAIDCIAKKCGPSAVDRIMKNCASIFGAASSAT